MCAVGIHLLELPYGLALARRDRTAQADQGPGQPVGIPQIKEVGLVMQRQTHLGHGVVGLVGDVGIVLTVGIVPGLIQLHDVGQTDVQSRLRTDVPPLRSHCDRRLEHVQADLGVILNENRNGERAGVAAALLHVIQTHAHIQPIVVADHDFGDADGQTVAIAGQASVGFDVAARDLPGHRRLRCVHKDQRGDTQRQQCSTKIHGRTVPGQEGVIRLL